MKSSIPWNPIRNWLVVWSIFYFPIFSYTGNGEKKPTDEIIFFRGLAQPPTRKVPKIIAKTHEIPMKSPLFAAKLPSLSPPQALCHGASRHASGGAGIRSSCPFHWDFMVSSGCLGELQYEISMSVEFSYEIAIYHITIRYSIRYKQYITIFLRYRWLMGIECCYKTGFLNGGTGSTFHWSPWKTFDGTRGVAGKSTEGLGIF